MATIQTINDWSVVQQARLIGQTAHLREGELWFKVRILNVKTAYGEVRLQVSPVDGNGCIWVSSSRIRLTNDTLKALDPGCHAG